MKNKTLKTLMMTVCLTAMMASAAFAATPRENVALATNVITVGDVFADITHDADHVLAPAPAYGETMTLTVSDLQRISDAFNLGWVPATHMEQVVLRRDAHEIDHATIEAAIAQSLSNAVNGQKFELQMADANLSFHLPENAGTDIDVTNLKYDLSRGEFHATVSAPKGAATPIVRKDVSGKLFAVVEVPVLRTALHSGDVISMADIDYTPVRNGDIGSNVITDASKLVGMSPRRNIASLKPITVADVILPVIIKKGDLVTMTLKSNLMTLTTQGQALENAANGETVRVMNISSKQALDAIVTGPKSVAVNAPLEAFN